MLEECVQACGGRAHTPEERPELASAVSRNHTSIHPKVTHQSGALHLDPLTNLYTRLTVGKPV